MSIPWYYRCRFANWLIAKPWPRKDGWRYRSVYRAQREGFPPAREMTEVEVAAVAHITARGTMDRWRRPPAGRLRSAWRALTFPHVHHDSEYDE